MEMQQVRYFLAVAKELNFTKAAKICNVSQPSQSRAIQALEEEKPRERAGTSAFPAVGALVREAMRKKWFGAQAIASRNATGGSNLTLAARA
jgi:hypothetical protein